MNWVAFIRKIVVDKPLGARKFRRKTNQSGTSLKRFDLRYRQIQGSVSRCRRQNSNFEAADRGVHDERLLNKVHHLFTHHKTREFRRFDDVH